LASRILHTPVGFTTLRHAGNKVTVVKHRNASF
jgi:hypothetical protein